MRIYEVKKKTKNNNSFNSSGAQEYFRTYDVPEEYFKTNKESYSGLTVPFSVVEGKSSEKERSKNYYLTMYAKK